MGYVVDWLRCARENGLTVSYVGGWNEHYQGTPVQQAWFVNLRAALDAAGFTGTQIVAADDTPQAAERRGRMGYAPLLAWQTVAGDMVTDPSFGRAVSVLGVHDTCGLPTTGYRCVVAAQARTLAARTGKPLWESELGATPATGTNPALPGPGGLARALNDAYNQAGITGILVWPLIDAIQARRRSVDRVAAVYDHAVPGMEDERGVGEECPDGLEVVQRGPPAGGRPLDGGGHELLVRLRLS